MSEEIIPEELQQPSDVTETINEAEASVNYFEKSLSELVESFQALKDEEDKTKKFKEAEAIKSAFYKRLTKEKAEIVDSEGEEKTGLFDAIEEGFKSLFADYKRERAEHNKQQEKEREENLAAKQAIIEDLKAIVEKQEDVSATFPEFREIQNRWRAVGPVPVQNYRDLNDTYQFYVEKFYDMVKINRDLRDLDFKKNLDAKEKFCEIAEKLAENDNIVDAFRELQKLHEQWKEFGPVAKEYREQIWDRFKAATAVINKRYQAFFESQKEAQVENLAAKTALCEKIEELCTREVGSSVEWNNLSKEVEEIQKNWKSIGFASKKENQKIYDRFRAACDKFYENKRAFYTDYKDSMNANLAKKEAIIAEAEALKTSTEWKKTTDQFINLQKQWKEIGSVPRKKSEQLWKRFRAACDEFFAEREKNAKPENDFYANLKAKKKLIEDVIAYEVKDDIEAVKAAAKEFNEKWQAIGFVPFKEKENINKSFKEAMQAKFPDLFSNGRAASKAGRQPRTGKPRSEKDILIQKYNALQQDVDTYENNIGFFAMSKNAEALIKQMQENIDKAKADLKELEAQIRKMESEAQEQE